MSQDLGALQRQAKQELEQTLEPIYERFKPFSGRLLGRYGQTYADYREAYLLSDDLSGKSDRHTDAISYCLQAIEEALAANEFLELAQQLDALFELSVAFDLGLEAQQDRLEELVKILAVEEGEKLFEVESPSIYLPELLIRVDDDLLRVLSRNPKLLFDVPSRRFEELIADLFSRQGFEVQLTKRTRDGGRDIIAFLHRFNITTKYLVECKRYAPERRVGIEIVHRLFGVKIAEAANKAILATTSGFTKPALTFAQNHLWDLDLKDYQDICKWLSPYAS